MGAPNRAKTIRHYMGEELVANDFRDDRLAIILKMLSDDERWSGIRGELTERFLRVYDLTVEAIRLDTTTVSRQELGNHRGGSFSIWT